MIAEVVEGQDIRWSEQNFQSLSGQTLHAAIIESPLMDECQDLDPESIFTNQLGSGLAGGCTLPHTNGQLSGQHSLPIAPWLVIPHHAGLPWIATMEV